MEKSKHTTLLDIEYAGGRDKKRALRYRLRRRTQEVLSAIDQYAEDDIKDIIDLGTADGRMLDMVHQKYPQACCLGVEYSRELVEFGKTRFHDIEIIHGDIQSLDFPDNSFDIAIAAAVIEHVPEPDKVLKEAKRILRKGGILILTSPDPFWERLATIVGHLKAERHNKVMNLKQLSELATQAGFTVLKTQKFMLSPVGMPFETAFEKFIRMLHLDFLMANQLLVAKA